MWVIVGSFSVTTNKMAETAFWKKQEKQDREAIELKFLSNLDSKGDDGNISATKSDRVVRTQTRMGAILYRIREYLRLSSREIRHRKINYVLGFSAVFMVVTVIAVSMSALDKAPLVFLRLAEIDVSETDIQLEPGSWTRNPTLNYTGFNEIVSQADPDQYSYSTVRSVFSGTLFPMSQCDSSVNGVDPFETQWRYEGIYSGSSPPSCSKYPYNKKRNCFGELCTKAYDTTVYAIDHDKEKRMGLGRKWQLPALEMGQAYIHSSLAKAMGIQSGDIVFLEWLAYNYHSAIISSGLTATNITKVPAYIATKYMYVPFVIKDVFSDPAGKFELEETEAFVVDFSTLLKYGAMHMDNRTDPSFISHFGNSNQYHYAERILVNLPPPRHESYLDENFDNVRAKVSKFASELVFRAGFNQLNPEVPVLYAMRNTRMLSLFLGLVLNIIIVVLVALAIVLIFSLLMIGVEAKTFDMGVLRMIGMTRFGLVEMLLLQTVLFSVPAWGLGLIVAQAASVVVADLFKDATAVAVDPYLTPNSILNATIWGMLVPLLSAIVPIRTALGVALRDALDLRRSKTTAVKVSIDRAESRHLEWPIIIVGVALAIFGFMIYYIFPLALLSFNLSLLMNVFLFLIIGMLLGLVMLSLNIERTIEQIILAVFLWWEKAAVREIVGKNLTSHRIRNRKTTVMYTMALGFIILVAVAFNSQMQSQNYDRQQGYGSYMKLIGRGTNSISNWENFDTLCRNTTLINGCAWVSHPMTDATTSIESTKIQNLGRTFGDTNYVYAVGPDVFSQMISTYLFPSDYDEKSPYNIEEQLYTERGSGSIVIGTAYKENLRLERGTHIILENSMTTDALPVVNISRLQCLAFLDAAPFFDFSKYPSRGAQDALVSFPSYVRLSKGAFRSVRDIPIEALVLNIKPNMNSNDRDTLKALLRNAMLGQKNLRILDYVERVKPMESATEIMNMFLEFTTIVAMAVCFFSLSSSMYANIHEQSKEIGILRAIGLPKPYLVRAYVWEAFVLILAASALGIMIGTVIGWTMTLQMQLFSQLPVSFSFPANILLIVFGMSVALALFSSLGPILKLLKLPIVETMRKLD